MTISRARKKLSAEADKAKADAKAAENKRNAAYTALEKAWTDADDEAQERFVNDYKIDLADFLRG